MKLKLTFNQKASLRPTKKRVFIGGVFLLILVGLVLWSVLHPSSNKEPELPPTKGQIVEYDQGSGGSPADVIKYHKKAVSLWEKGDAKKAQAFAIKGLEANKMLTSKQRNQIDNQSIIIYDLYDLSRGTYNNVAE